MHRFRTVLIVGVGLLTLIQPLATTYGQDRESCETEGTVLTTQDNLASTIENGEAGATFLLRGGTYTLRDNVNIPAGRSGNPVTIKPYQCQEVTIETNGYDFRLKSFNVLAGLTIVGTRGTGNVVRLQGGESTPIQGVIIQHNAIVDGEHSAIRITGNVVDTLIKGNHLTNPGGANSTVRLRSAGRFRPDGTVIVGNRFADCGEDCFQPQDVDSFTLSGNEFRGPARENLLDIKRFHKDALVADNVFRCSNSRSGCVLVHSHDSMQGVELAFENNHLLGCPVRASRQMTLGYGGDRHTTHVRGNTFDPDATCQALRIGACANCDVDGNTFH